MFRPQLLDMRVTLHAGTIYLQLISPTLTILTVVDEQGVTSNAPNKKLVHNVHHPHVETQSETQHQGERGDQGTITKGPLEAPPECVSCDDHINEDARDTVKLETSRSECWCPTSIPT